MLPFPSRPRRAVCVLALIDSRHADRFQLHYAQTRAHHALLEKERDLTSKARVASTVRAREVEARDSACNNSAVEAVDIVVVTKHAAETLTKKVDGPVAAAIAAAANAAAVEATAASAKAAAEAIAASAKAAAKRLASRPHNNKGVKGAGGAAAKRRAASAIGEGVQGDAGDKGAVTAVATSSTSTETGDAGDKGDATGAGGAVGVTGPTPTELQGVEGAGGDAGAASKDDAPKTFKQVLAEAMTPPTKVRIRRATFFAIYICLPSVHTRAPPGRQRGQRVAARRQRVAARRQRASAGHLG